MKNKGFTLIELLGVIVILALLMVLVMPKIINSLKSSSEKVDDLTLEMIYNATDLYIDEYEDNFKFVNGNKYCITLTDLTEEKYLKSPINVNDKDITNLKTVQVTYNDGFKYELIDNDECEEILILQPGLYDENDNMLASWYELVNDYGLDIETYHADENVVGTFKYVLKNNSKLSAGVKIIIPEGVTKIGDSTFCECDLTSVTIPNSVTSIGSFAFCANKLTSVTIPSSVTSIGVWAFVGNNDLTSVTIPSNVTSIGELAFALNSKLETIKVDKNNPIYNSGDNANAIIETATNTLISGCKNTVIPYGVTSIGYAAFAGTGLTNITIPESVTSIGELAFAGTGLTSITIPSSVTSIGEGAFDGCDSLTTINYSGTATGYPWDAPNIQ